MAREYYSITTKKFTLRTSHFGWLCTTRNLYNNILEFYYGLYLEHEELHDLNSQNAMRGLEKLTIVGRDKQPVPEPLPWKKVPLYFRRAAINEAIAAGKSYLGRQYGSKGQENPSVRFDSGMTFYKGMYEELTSRSVELKVYDGESWRWLHCRLSGNEIPVEAESMSPRLVFKASGVEVCKRIELHVPVKTRVEDGRKLKDRMTADLKICSLQFTDRDRLSVCCIMDWNGEVCGVHFVRGGRDYESRCGAVLEKIERSKKACGDLRVQGDNKKHWKKLQDLSEDMAHQVSSEIIDFCKKHQASVIILPEYSQGFTRRMMRRSGPWSVLRLSSRIIEKLNYKAWHHGILIVHVEASQISRLCAVCAEPVQKKGEEYVCPNGHKGNRHLNSARNLGKKFLKNMKEKR